MASGNAIRGIRVGAGPERPDERAVPAPRRVVTYWCANGHHHEPQFAADAQVPPVWECPRCGQPAGQDPAHPPGRSRNEPYKSHLAYVKERRTEEEGAAILADALRQLRQRRGEE